MPTVLVACALGVFAYASGNAVFSEYLQIPQVPGAGELVIICAAIAGAGLGFLWFNTYPAMVFMGDIGALALGAVLGTHRGDRAPGTGAGDHGRHLRDRDAVGDDPGGARSSSPASACSAWRRSTTTSNSRAGPSRA